MRLRKLATLVAILGAGAAFEVSYAVRHDLGFGPEGFRILSGRFYGPSFGFERPMLSEPVADGTTALVVRNAFGSVTVGRGEPGRVEARLRVVVFRPTEPAARAFAERVVLESSAPGDTLVLGTNRDGLEAERDVGFETHLDVRVPAGIRVDVDNSYGPVTVSDVSATRVVNSYDDVRVERIAGATSVDSRHGAVHASSIAGSLSVAARHDDVEVADVTGAVQLDVDSGDVRLDRVAGAELKLSHGDATLNDVAGSLVVEASGSRIEATGVESGARIQTSYDDVIVSDVGGLLSVVVRSGGVQVAGARGGVEVESSYDDVVLERVTGPVVVRVRHGGVDARDVEGGARIEADDDVQLEAFSGPVVVAARQGSIRLVPAAALDDSIEASAGAGGVTLAVSADAPFQLDAQATGGEVSVDLPGFVASASEASRVVGRLGDGGPSVTLRASRGDVSVVRR